MTNYFLPPGVQRIIHETLGYVPQAVPEATAKHIEELWAERNRAPDEDLDRIDRLMYLAVLRVEDSPEVQAWTHGMSFK